MPADHIVLLFDIDGTLIDTGGAGAASWRLAFDELYGTPADIGKYTDAGMTDSQVARQTFEAVAQGACKPARTATEPPLRNCRRLDRLPRSARRREASAAAA